MKPAGVRGRGLVPGLALGEAVVSRKAFTFAHGVDPESGEVTDIRSDIRGSNVRGKVLCYPFGKGSTTASAWFMETVRLRNSPAALVTEEVDLSGVIGSVLAGLVYGSTIPVISGVKMSSLSGLAPRTVLAVDGETGEVVIRA